MLEEGKIECLYLNGGEWYDRNYFFLDSLCLDTFWATGTAPREIYFAIKDFKVLE